ncbi:hypothetical protein KCU65_g6312, partial [Aureobasidium melanogenum]
MEKLKKIFSPGHEQDENVMYNDPKTSGTSTTRDSAAPTQHTVGSSTKDTNLRQDVLDPQTNTSSRPNMTDNLSTASIRSGVVGAAQEPRNVEGTGFTDYATAGGLAAPQQKLPVRSVTPVGQSRPKPTQMETMDPSGFVNSSHAHRGLGHNYNGDPCPEGQEPPNPGYVHHQHGPHSTDIANQLDPHVPGGFPSDDGLDTSRGGGLTSGSTGLGSGAYAGEQRTGASGNHYGRDAALGTAAGAAGIGAYEHAHHHNNMTSQVNDPNHDPLLAEQRQERLSDFDAAMAGNQRSQPNAYNASSDVVSPSTTERSFPLSSHPTTATGSRDVASESRTHHGRDAALVGGGLGAAGLAAHEAGSHRPSHEMEGFDDQRYDPSAASGDKPTRIPNLMYGTGHSGHGVNSAETASGASYGREALPGHSVNPSETASGLGAGALAGTYESPEHRTGGVPRQGVSAAETASGQQYGREPLSGHGVNAAETASGQPYAGSQMQNYGRSGPTETDPASKTVGPHKSNLMNVIDPRVQPEPEKMKDRTTAGPHQSDMMNRADPRVDSDLSKQNEHHYGRDAAVAGGLGTAGAGAYEYGKHHNQNPESIGTSAFDPRSTNTTNLVDPNHDPILEQQRIERQRAYDSALAGGTGAGSAGAYGQSYPQGGAAQSTLETSPFASRSANTDPALAQQQSGHHYGRDAAVAGGLGAAGAGAYEYGKHHNQPAENVGTSTFDPRSTNTSNVVDPSTDPTLAQQQQGHHYGRDAALVGGAGAAGAGAYEYGKHHNQPAESIGTSAFDPRSTKTTNVVDPNHDPTLAREREERQHFARDAAVAGGAGAAGYGAYEALDPKEQEKLAKHQAHEAEKARKAQQHQMDKDMKHQQHQTEKDLKHQQKEREHEIAKQEKKAEKEREKEADRSEKEAERATRENEHPEKKKHGILGFLHRDKKNEPEEDLRSQGRLQEADIAAHERHQRELEARAADGSIPAAGARFEPSLEEQRANPLSSAPYNDIQEHGHQTVSTDTSGRHRLHKDPPASVLKERGLETDHPYGDSHGANVRIA